jgi:hypothetical protein
MGILEEVKDECECVGDFNLGQGCFSTLKNYGGEATVVLKIGKAVRNAAKRNDPEYRSNLVRAAALIINTIERYDERY